MRRRLRWNYFIDQVSFVISHWRAQEQGSDRAREHRFPFVSTVVTNSEESFIHILFCYQLLCHRRLHKNINLIQIVNESLQSGPKNRNKSSLRQTKDGGLDPSVLNNSNQIHPSEENINLIYGHIASRILLTLLNKSSSSDNLTFKWFSTTCGAPQGPQHGPLSSVYLIHFYLDFNKHWIRLKTTLHDVCSDTNFFDYTGPDGPGPSEQRGVMTNQSIFLWMMILLLCVGTL